MPYTYLRGTNGDTAIDFISAAAPGVMFAAGSGNDSISGSNFADFFNGGAGNDSVMGRAGNDVMTDGSGQDYLYGGEGSFDPGGLSNSQILARLGGGNDTFVLVNDGAFDVIAGFDGIGTGHRGAGPHDFLWLKGFAAGSNLVFDQYLGSSLGGYTTASIWQSTQFYKVETSGGVLQDYVILVSFAETKAEADRTLVAGDYGWMA
jgi:Ca2+-binding RTX toxin-like protein